MQTFADIEQAIFPLCCLLIGFIAFGIIGLNMLSNNKIRKQNQKYQDDQINWEKELKARDEINKRFSSQVNNESNFRQLFVWAKGLTTQDKREITRISDLIYTDPTNSLAKNTILATLSISRLLSLAETNEDAAKFILELVDIYPSYLPFQEINDSNRVYASLFLNKISAKKECSRLLARLVAHALVGGLYSPEQIQTIHKIQDSVYFQDYEDTRDDDDGSGSGYPQYFAPTIGDAGYWDFFPEHSSSDNSYRVTGRHTLRQTIMSENKQLNFLKKFSRGNGS